MSRRGKNNVKRAIVNDATSIFGGAAEPTKIATHNFNPLFHYLQTMFPNYDNAVLNAVLEQEGNSIERAIEVLLTFAAPEPKGRPINEKEASTLDEIAFSDLSDTDDTPSNVFTLPVMPPVTSQNSGRDHVSLYEYRKKRKTTKSQRARRRQRAQAQAAAALAAQNKVKKVKWVPLQEFIAETKNPFDSLAGGDDELVRLLQPSGVELPATDYGAFEQKPAVEVEDDTVDEDETQSLLTQDEIEESWRNFEATQEIDEPQQPQLNVEEEEEAQEPTLESSIESSAEDFGNSNTYEWLHYTPPSPQQQLLELDEESCSPSSSDEEEEDFVVIEEQQPATQPIELLPVEVPAPVVVVPSNAVEQQQQEEAKKDEPVVVVKLYYSASDIHRLGLRRSAFTFVKLFDYAAAYLQGKCQQLARSALPRAFALTYVDDEGDVIHLCSEEELAEALRLHEEVFWVDGKQPLLRVHIKALDVAANDGHIVIGA